MELRTDRYKLKELFPDKANKYAQKLHIKADNIDFIRKGIPIEPKDITIEEGERAAIRYITTPRLDRDSEILIPEGAMLDDFRQSPSVLYGHDYKGRLPIGKDIWIKTTKRGILAKTQYATHQFAEDLFQCVKGGFLNSNSVGFIPVEGINLDENKDEFVKWQDILEMEYGVDKEESGKAKTIYTKWIMLEHSDVPVASNAQSLNVLVSKGDLPIKSKELLKDLEVDIEVEDFQEEVEIENEVQTMTPEELKEHYRGLQEVEVVEDEGDEEVEITPVPTAIDEESDLQDTINELIEEGIEDVEDLAFDDVEEKRFDLEGNPSVWDIMDAISSTIRTPMNSKTWRYVTDLYPVKYPDGHVIIEESSEKTERKYFLHSYDYDGGKIKLGESKELEATYQPKERGVLSNATKTRLLTPGEVFPEVLESEGLSEIKEMLTELKEGRVLSRKNREVVKAAVNALADVLKADSTGSREDDDKEEVEDEKGVEVTIEKGEYSAEEIQVMVNKALDKAVTNMNLPEAINKAVKTLQGKVE